jgi:hypothetical protein
MPTYSPNGQSWWDGRWLPTPPASASSLPTMPIPVFPARVTPTWRQFIEQRRNRIWANVAILAVIIGTVAGGVMWVSHEPAAQPIMVKELPTYTFTAPTAP